MGLGEPTFNQPTQAEEQFEAGIKHGLAETRTSFQEGEHAKQERERLAVENEQLKKQISQLQLQLAEKTEALEKAEKEATSDPLTGLFNRRGFEQALNLIRSVEEFEGNKREVKEGVNQFALLALDIDNFKLFNDLFGHDVGDAVLKMAAEYLQKQFRDNDMVARFGGEEFIGFLQDVDLAKFSERMGFDADRNAHTLHFDVALIKNVHPDGSETYRVATADETKLGQHETWRVSFSGGLVPFKPGVDNLEGKMKEADGILYDAKQRGRNRIGTSGEFPKFFDDTPPSPVLETK